MAERRMFAKTIIDSDAFLDMPVTARLLYYDLAMRADDDGFMNSPKKVMRMVGASEDDLRILCLRKFIIPFESGVVVIKHWKIHNYIRKDMYHETKYKDEMAMLELDENSAYTLPVTDSLQGCNEVVAIPSTQDRIGKDRLGEDRIGKDSKGKAKKAEPAVYFEDEELNEAFKDFISYRKTIKKPLNTDRAIKLNLDKLISLATKDGLFDKQTALDVINQTIERGWSGFFELKSNAPKSDEPMFK